LENRVDSGCGLLDRSFEENQRIYLIKFNKFTEKKVVTQENSSFFSELPKIEEVFKLISIGV